VWALGSSIDFRTSRVAPLRGSGLLGEYWGAAGKVTKMRALVKDANGGAA